MTTKFDPAKHPRWPKGTPKVGGQFLTASSLVERLTHLGGSRSTRMQNLDFAGKGIPGVAHVHAFMGVNGQPQIVVQTTADLPESEPVDPKGGAGAVVAAIRRAAARGVDKPSVMPGLTPPANSMTVGTLAVGSQVEWQGAVYTVEANSGKTVKLVNSFGEPQIVPKTTRVLKLEREDVMPDNAVLRLAFGRGGGIPWEEQKHPRWPKGTPKRGGQFMEVGEFVHWIKDVGGALATIKDFRAGKGNATIQGTDGTTVIVPLRELRPATDVNGKLLGTAGFTSDNTHLIGNPPFHRGALPSGEAGLTWSDTGLANPLLHPSLRRKQNRAIERFAEERGPSPGPDWYWDSGAGGWLQKRGAKGPLRLGHEEGTMLSLAKSVYKGKPALADAMGRIHSIVKSAHKWGGDGRRPIFRKIRARLMAEHPEVIAKAFGGDPNKAAGWVKARWYQTRGRKVPATTGKHALSLAAYGESDAELSFGYQEIPDSMVDHLESLGVTHELYLSDPEPATAGDGLVWKTVARTGTWKVSPLPGGDPLVIDNGFLDDLVSGFSEKAWPNVTVPLSHKDRIEENTGFVRQLIKVEDADKPGEYKLRAGIEFTEPDIREKVLRGTIADTSIGADLKGVARTEDGRRFPRVLKHVALTNAPWLNGLDPFGDQLAASLASWEPSDDEDDVDIDTLGDDLDAVGGPEEVEMIEMLEDDDDAGEAWTLALADPDDADGMLELKQFSADERKGLAKKGQAMPHGGFPIRNESDLRKAIRAIGRAKFPEATKRWITKRAKALGLTKLLPDSWQASTVTASRGDGDPVLRLHRGGDKNMDGETVEMTQDQLATFVEEAIRRDRESRDVRLSQAERRLHEADVREVVRELQEAGYAPALCTRAEELLLAADPEPTSVLTLSRDEEDGQTVTQDMTVRDIVLSILEAVPASSLHLDQPKVKSSAVKPREDSVRKSARERAEELWAETHGEAAGE